MKKYVVLSVLLSACALQGMYPGYGQGQRGMNFVADPHTGGRVAVAVYPPLMQEHPGQPSNHRYGESAPPAAQQQSDIAALAAAVQQLNAHLSTFEQNVNDKLHWLDQQQLALAKLVRDSSGKDRLARADGSLCFDCGARGTIQCDKCLREYLRGSINYAQEKE